ncbi:macro domain-containing protein [Thioflexithrix psekupsensis]|uniref:Macro domain-containing protein n=1 Tax=Thioflexithrix psekupsensis TaxID=1570016 RepID=A0A251X759_9GAMM|nr:macro domain-containing protein [Thioflexithrix psekupsensis]OUD13811.1 hypothetical protein TPSD3_05520 [Thioflexithrix psekupsensis]
MQNKIELFFGDITLMDVDAIVNAASPTLSGSCGVEAVIHRYGGLPLSDACETLGGCETGQAKITRGHDLPAKFVIHTVGPVWLGGKYGEAELLRSCYRNALRFSLTRPIKTIAFSSISCGASGYPIEEACQIALDTIQEFLDTHPDTLEKVCIMAYNIPILETYRRELEARFGESELMTE